MMKIAAVSTLAMLGSLVTAESMYNTQKSSVMTLNMKNFEK